MSELSISTIILKKCFILIAFARITRLGHFRLGLHAEMLPRHKG